MTLLAEVGINRNQARALGNWEALEIYYSSGKGGGKTHCLAWFLVGRSAKNPPDVRTLCIEPTYPMIGDNMIPEIEKVFDRLGATYRYNKNEHTYVWGPEQRVIWLRSADRPERLAGPTVGCLGIDEAAQTPSETYHRAITRLRDERATVLQAMMVGTHEGTGTWFARNIDAGGSSRFCVRGTSFDNLKHTGDTYRQILENAYEPGTPQWQMYVEGIATALSGNIYTRLSQANIRECHNPTEGQQAAGFDFNVAGKCSPVGRFHNGVLHIWGEVLTKERGGTDEQAQKVAQLLVDKGAARIIRGDLVDMTGQQIDACIDATGDSQKSSASHTDKEHIQRAGFYARHPAANPYVRDRIDSVQAALRDGRLLIDPLGAPMTLKALREHSYDKHEKPRKSWGADEFPLDNPMDALGYMVWHFMPLRSKPSLPHDRQVHHNQRTLKKPKQLRQLPRVPWR